MYLSSPPHNCHEVFAFPPLFHIFFLNVFPPSPVHVLACESPKFPSPDHCLAKSGQSWENQWRTSQWKCCTQLCSPLPPTNPAGPWSPGKLPSIASSWGGFHPSPGGFARVFLQARLSVQVQAREQGGGGRNKEPRMTFKVLL